MKRLKGNIIQEGLVYGNLLIEDNQKVNSVTKVIVDDFKKELIKFKNALKELKKDFEKIISKTKTAEEKEILTTHLFLIADEFVNTEIENKIKDRFSAIYAINFVYSKYIEQINQNSKLKESRGKDFIDIKNQLLQKILTKNTKDVPKKPFIVVAEELFPSTLTKYKSKHLKGFISRQGGKTSHIAIILKSLQIPYISNIDVKKLKDDEFVLLDANKGEVILNPTVKKQEQIFKPQTTGDINTFKVLTKSNKEINLKIDVFNHTQLDTLKKGTPIGLLRSELFYLEKQKLPQKNKQIDFYYSVFEKAYPEKAIIRLIDLSVDKLIPALKIEKETITFDDMGIRLINRKPKVFYNQLEAILTAYDKFNKGELNILLPMFSHKGELILIKEMIDEIFSTNNFNFTKDKIKIGIMVEIVITALELENYLKDADFVSIGTNDLVKNVFMISRNNPNYNYQIAYENKAFLKLLEYILEKCNKYNKEVYVCGYMPNNFKGICNLIKIGYRNFTVSVENLIKYKDQIKDLEI